MKGFDRVLHKALTPQRIVSCRNNLAVVRFGPVLHFSAIDSNCQLEVMMVVYSD